MDFVIVLPPDPIFSGEGGLHPINKRDMWSGKKRFFDAFESYRVTSYKRSSRSINNNFIIQYYIIYISVILLYYTYYIIL